MTERDWLSRARRINRELEALTEERQRIYGQCTSITARAEGINVSGTSDPHKFDGLAALGYEIDRRRKELEEMKVEILQAINTLQESNLRTVLFRRYISCESWNKIATAMNYSKRHMFRVHDEALAAIKDVIECHLTPVL